MNSKILKTGDYTHINGGSMVSTERIIKETALTIRINGKHYATAMIMAALEKEFIYGHLFAQGIIRSANDIKSLTIQNNTAEVRLAAIIIAKTAADKVDSSLIVTTAEVF